MPQFNWWAILGAAVAGFALGGLWWSPVLFMKSWMKLAGVKESDTKKGMAQAMVVNIISLFLMVWILAHAFHNAQVANPGMIVGLSGGIKVGFFNWLGFVFPPMIGRVVFEKSPFKLFLINAGYYLAALLIEGAILGNWL